ncbi:MAG: carbon-nitrogen hydrolase family protein [Candidatus Lokiarchaeota archaeon]|nr:carbon-nitrogen hydrolase family protein [Candidatus Lokiarchaeota archaeon]
MKVACIQPKIHQDIEKCYTEIEILLKNLLKEFNNCNIICLPERWTPFFNDMSHNIQDERGENCEFIKDLAKKYEISILSGAIWEKRDNQKKPFITCYYFNEKGQEIGRQDKIHLYSYEQEYFEPGRVLNIFKLDKTKFAILICFDVAFFEIPRLAVENGADIIFSPTQISIDGMYNWKIYLQARALENRIPVVGCNTLGKICNKIFPGNSKIISFIKGSTSPAKINIIEALTNDSCFLYENIDLDYLKILRDIRLNEVIDKDSIKVEKIN